MSYHISCVENCIPSCSQHWGFYLSLIWEWKGKRLEVVIQADFVNGLSKAHFMGSIHSPCLLEQIRYRSFLYLQSTIWSQRVGLRDKHIQNKKRSERHSVVSDSATPRTIPSVEFTRPEYWSGWPFPSPGDFPTQGLNPGGFFTSWATRLKTTGEGSLSLLQQAKHIQCNG